VIEYPIVLRELRIGRIEQLTPTIRRVVLVGDELGELTRDGIACPAFVTGAPDDHVKIFPSPDGPPPVLPTQAEGHLDWPEDPPAVARDYTVRSFDADSGEMVIDLVTDHDGPGATWARDAQVGASLHVAGPARSIEHPLDAPATILVGDEAALPAIARFLDELADPATAAALVVVDRHNVDYPLPDGARVQWLVRTAADRAAGIDTLALDEALAAALDATPDAFVWVATEYSTARRLRRVLRDRGVDRKQSYVAHYWRHDVDDRVEALVAAEREMRAMTDLMAPWALRVAATIGLADAIEDGADTADAIAVRAGTDPGATAILLDYLAERHVVHAAGDGSFTLGRTGELLLTEDEHGWRDHLDLGGGNGHMATAMAGMLTAVQTGGSGYEAVHGRTFWESLAADERLGSTFDEHLADWARDWAPAVAGHPIWSDAGRIVDVGGGTGTLVAAVAAAHPHVEATVVEVAGTAERARHHLAHAGLAARTGVVESSFFDPLPAGADTYVLAQVLHDWPDADAARILARVAEALPADGRLLIVERLPADDGSPGGRDDRPDAGPDADAAAAEHGAGEHAHDDEHAEMSVLMLTVFGARERGLDGYRSLVEAAGLRVAAVHRPGPWLCLIEARAAGTAPSRP